MEQANTSSHSPEELSQRKRRLLFRATHRGTREADILIGGFVQTHLDSFTLIQVTLLEQLLEESDVDIMGWMIGRTDPPAVYAGPLMDAMRRLDYLVPPR